MEQEEDLNSNLDRSITQGVNDAALDTISQHSPAGGRHGHVNQAQDAHGNNNCFGKLGFVLHVCLDGGKC